MYPLAGLAQSWRLSTAAMASELQGPRTAIVTGGAKRIGAEISRALAADGWHVLIHFNRSQPEA